MHLRGNYGIAHATQRGGDPATITKNTAPYRDATGNYRKDGAGYLSKMVRSLRRLVRRQIAQSHGASADARVTVTTARV